MIKKLLKISLTLILIILVFLPFSLLQAHLAPLNEEINENGSDSLNLTSGNETQAIIYYNEACGMCGQYVHEELPAMLRKQGINSFIEKDYINEKNNRSEMNQLMKKLAIPFPLQSHIMTFVGEKFILAGHIPAQIIDDLFQSENSQKFKRIIVYQDEMHNEVKDYKVWAIPGYALDWSGEIMTYPIQTRITEYLDYLEKNKDNFELKEKVNNQYNKYESLLPIILVSGFLDGINPCAFAVLLFFIAFLFSLKRTRTGIWKMGLVYIGAIYLAYLSIGFGLLKAILFTNTPHFMAQVGSWLVIGLGVISLLGYLFPKFPLKLRLPQASKATLENWMYKATLPAAFILGFLVGLCTFPCSGGIYVAIIGLLATKTTYWQGVNYLLIYNLMFVVPLFIILILSSNKYAVEKLTKWEQTESKKMKIISALTMIILGIIILVWFT